MLTCLYVLVYVWWSLRYNNLVMQGCDRVAIFYSRLQLWLGCPVRWLSAARKVREKRRVNHWNRVGWVMHYEKFAWCHYFGKHILSTSAKEGTPGSWFIFSTTEIYMRTWSVTRQFVCVLSWCLLVKKTPQKKHSISSSALWFQSHTDGDFSREKNKSKTDKQMRQYMHVPTCGVAHLFWR